MKKIVLFIIIVAFGFVFMMGISNSIDLFNYNDTLNENSVSNGYINKNVTGETDEIVYGQTNSAETGSANMVTSIVVNYRSFDTLGEVTVLFLSAMGVSILLGASNSLIKRKKSGFILKTAATMLFPVLLITGIYIFTHGHLTPGGGFPGGAMIASSFLLLYLADETFMAKINNFKILEGVSGIIYIIIGVTGLFVGGYFLKNFLPTGTIGNLISAGIIPIIYVFIGIKVGSEITSIISNFLKKEVDA